MTEFQKISITATFGGLAIFLTLWSWGQPLICTCGEVKLWINSIWSSGNSQHIADWYTLSHIVHGLMIVPIGRVIFPRITFRWLFAVALLTGVAWEIVEHTNFVLDQFRATTVNQGYLGDSVLNSVADYVFMMAGFFVGWMMRPLWTLALIVTLELSAAIIARDSLILEAVMLVHRFEVIEEWQQDINPRRNSATDIHATD